MDIAKKADGTTVAPEVYLEDLKRLEAERVNLREQEALLAAQESTEGTEGKQAKKKRSKQTPLKMYMVFCTDEVCRKPVHLINRPSAEGHQYIHEDPTIPPLNLKFAHFGKGHKYAANPKCDLYNKGERYANLKENPHAKEIGEKVEAVLGEPVNAGKFEKILKTYFGEQKPEFIGDLIKKASKEVTHREVLISHPELFLAYAALKAGYHGHKSGQSGKIHSTIYKVSKWRSVQFTGMDGRKHKVNAPARIKLWYRDGIGDRKAGPYTGWEFQIPFNRMPYVLPKVANNNSPPSGAAPSSVPPAATPTSTPQTAAAPAAAFTNIPSDAPRESLQPDLFSSIPALTFPSNSTAETATPIGPQSATSSTRPTAHPSVVQAGKSTQLPLLFG